MDIPWDATANSLLLKSEGDSGRIHVKFYDEDGSLSGELYLSPTSHIIERCRHWTAYPTTPPSTSTRNWEISYDYTTYHLVVRCNGVKVLDVTLNDGLCAGKGDGVWRSSWTKKTVKFQFSSDSMTTEYCTGTCK